MDSTEEKGVKAKKTKVVYSTPTKANNQKNRATLQTTCRNNIDRKMV
jgi:hypothetical protein